MLVVMILSAASTEAQLASSPVKPAEVPAKASYATVPFVGCESDGQVGPLKAPMGQSKRVEISEGAALRLAYYKAKYGFGVLAPRGWHCFSIYGSSGESLFVSPDSIDTKSLFSSEWEGFSAQVIQVSVSYGGTSGRFQVAKTIARVFPAYTSFVQNVIAEGIETASDFPTGPYPGDKLKYRGTRVVEFETPPNTKGLGTDSRLRSTPSPIGGVEILFGEEPNLLQLAMRIPDSNSEIYRIIVEQVESDVAQVKNDLSSAR